MAQSITRTDEEGNTFTDTFDIVNAGEAAAKLAEDQVLKFRNERQKAKIIVTKRDAKTDELLPGAVFNLYTRDDIYSADGELLFRAGDLLATSAPTGEDGAAVFDCDIPVQGQNYGKDSNGLPEIGNALNVSKNSGRYYVQELRPPEGCFLNSDPMQFVFTYTGEAISTVEQTCRNKATTVLISKRELTGDDELSGATLTIQDEDGNVVRQWVSGDKPTEIRGLAFDTVYTLSEQSAPDGYTIAESIRFKLVQRKDENGGLLDENDVYVCTGKDLFIFDRWEKMEDGTVVMRDAPAPQTPPSTPAPTPTPTPEHPAETPTPTPTPSIPQTGDSFPLIAVLTAALAALLGLVVVTASRRSRQQDDGPDPQLDPLDEPENKRE